MVIDNKYEEAIRSRFIYLNNELCYAKDKKIAGSVTDTGYRRVCVLYKQFKVHHIVFWLHTGRWPTLLDHKDRNRLNNDFNNLREATRSQNMYNSAHGCNTSGVKNVSWCKTHKKWIVRVTADKQIVFNKAFKSFEEAKEVAAKVTKQFHGEFART
jgi:hypothetical protein